MKRPWLYGVGFTLFVLEPFLYVSAASPVVLGSVSLVSMVFLAGGVFAFVSRPLFRLALWTIFTCLVIVLKVGILTQVAHSFVQDDSLEPYVASGGIASLALSLSALAYGAIQKLGKPKNA